MTRFSFPIYLICVLVGCRGGSMPEIIDFELQEVLPSSAGLDVVLLPVILTVGSNKLPTILKEAELEIIEKAQNSRSILAVANLQTPLRIEGGHSGQQKLELVLGIKRETWNRNILKSIRANKSSIVGDVVVIYDGHTYKREIDLPIPSEALNISLFDLVSAEFAFDTLDRISAKFLAQPVKDMKRETYLKDVLISIGTDGTQRPLRVKVISDVVVRQKNPARYNIVGYSMLDDVDRTLLDDIEANKRRVKVRIQGTLSSALYPSTDIDEIFYIDLGDKQHVTILPPPVHLISRLISFSSVNVTWVEGIGLLNKLLEEETLDLSFNAQNPLPGTIVVYEGAFRLLGPYHPEKKRRLEILRFVSRGERLKPRSTSQITGQVVLSKAAQSAWKTILIDISSRDLTGYCISSSIKVSIPLLGRIDINPSLESLLGTKHEYCEANQR